MRSRSRCPPRLPSPSPRSGPPRDIFWAGGSDFMTNELTPAELKARLDERVPLVLLDVRQDWETKLCRLENAGHISIEEMEHRTDEVDAADETFVYGHDVVQSADVAEDLRSLGFGNAKNLAGGLDAWARSIDPSMRRY